MEGISNSHVAEAQKQAVLFRDAVKAPGVVRNALGREPADLFHPVATPGPGIKVWNNSKRPVDCGAQSFAQRISRNHLRRVRVVRVQKKIDLGKDFLLETICRSPVHEVRALVLLGHGCGRVVRAKVADFVAAITHLDFPACHVGEDQHVRLRRNESGAGPNHESQPRVCLSAGERAPPLISRDRNSRQAGCRSSGQRRGHRRETVRPSG